MLTRLMDMSVIVKIYTQESTVKLVNNRSIIKCMVSVGLSVFERSLLYYTWLFYFDADINDCSSNTCLNGATCIDQVNGYACNCQPGYQGVHCQTSRLSFQILSICTFSCQVVLYYDAY